MKKFTGPNKVLLVLALGLIIGAHREDCTKGEGFLKSSACDCV
jgi:hypothetical protein